jgi:hypothetical protein
MLSPPSTINRGHPLIHPWAIDLVSTLQNSTPTTRYITITAEALLHNGSLCQNNNTAPTAISIGCTPCLAGLHCLPHKYLLDNYYPNNTRQHSTNVDNDHFPSPPCRWESRSISLRLVRWALPNNICLCVWLTFEKQLSEKINHL